MICTKNKYYVFLNWGLIMKPLLHLKTAVLIAYVALCTHLVLTVAQEDAPQLAGSWAQAVNY